LASQNNWAIFFDKLKIGGAKQKENQKPVNMPLRRNL
jgi:hypothetical protein